MNELHAPPVLMKMNTTEQKKKEYKAFYNGDRICTGWYIAALFYFAEIYMNVKSISHNYLHLATCLYRQTIVLRWIQKCHLHVIQYLQVALCRATFGVHLFLNHYFIKYVTASMGISCQELQCKNHQNFYLGKQA